MGELFEKFFPNGVKSLEQNFSIDPVWKEEINKWLACVYEIDTKYFERSKTRVTQDIWKQEETLAELRSIYFLKEKLGCTILALEPDRLDLTFTDKNGEKWFAEIKCPSYVKEILERDLSPKEKLERKQQPKNILETFSFDFNGYSDCIKKSVDKFESGKKNLLIISDDRMLSLVGDPFFEGNIKNELKQNDPDGKISAVLLLNVQGKLVGNFETKIEYIHRVATITGNPVF
ncbi:MAG: hypothetical protein KGI23_03720 [Patescibacteria group bacterium]|nr:hypothetical protein [Patescibacteria group bacterium]